jgi:hypothetical protein
MSIYMVFIVNSQQIFGWHPLLSARRRIGQAAVASLWTEKLLFQSLFRILAVGLRPFPSDRSSRLIPSDPSLTSTRTTTIMPWPNPAT